MEERAANAAYTRAWSAANPDKIKAANRRATLSGKHKVAYRKRVEKPGGRERINEQATRYYHANWEKKQDQKWARSHGIEWETVNEMRKQPCAICGEHKPRVKKPGAHSGMAIDHCHKTGKIRGTLCFACNSAIAFLRDDPTLMETAAAYVRRHAEA